MRNRLFLSCHTLTIRQSFAFLGTIYITYDSLTYPNPTLCWLYKSCTYMQLTLMKMINEAFTIIVRMILNFNCYFYNRIRNSNLINKMYPSVNFKFMRLTVNLYRHRYVNSIHIYRYRYQSYYLCTRHK